MDADLIKLYGLTKLKTESVLRVGVSGRCHEWEAALRILSLLRHNFPFSWTLCGWNNHGCIQGDMVDPL